MRASSLGACFMPSGLIFSTNAYGCFPNHAIAPILAILNSKPTRYLIDMLLEREGYSKYVPGVIQRIPFPAEISKSTILELEKLAMRAYKIKRSLAKVIETTHSYILPQQILSKLGQPTLTLKVKDLFETKDLIDNIVFALYDFNELDRESVVRQYTNIGDDSLPVRNKLNELPADNGSLQDSQSALLSWCVGVVLGRFDWRFITGEREIPLEPDPDDPLPTKSPGMLPDGAEPFHCHQGVLVDDPGYEHDLSQLIESVLEQIDIQAPDNVRRWLQKNFFKEHLKQYSKSRRKAPIYWPLSTASESYTLWILLSRFGRSDSLHSRQRFSRNETEVGGRRSQLAASEN